MKRRGTTRGGDGVSEASGRTPVWRALGVGAVALGLIGGGGTVAAQADAPEGVIVQEQLATGNELLVYVPDDPRTGLRARSTAMAPTLVPMTEAFIDFATAAKASSQRPGWSLTFLRT